MFQRGDAVRKGQVVVELQSAAERVAVESTRYRAQMEGQWRPARNRVDYTTKKLARVSTCRCRTTPRCQQRDEADAERRLADSELQDGDRKPRAGQIDYRRAVEQARAAHAGRAPSPASCSNRMLNPGRPGRVGQRPQGRADARPDRPLRVDIVLPARCLAK
jgi:multidrug efflux pump subunit AcrA (membrane-fusion protein)